jgi:hypothetical protein
MITRRNRLPWVLSWFLPLLAALWVLQLPQVWQREHADAGSARESGVRGTPALSIAGRLHAAGYDQATLGAALGTAIKQR